MDTDHLKTFNKIISNAMDIPIDKISDDMAYDEVENWDSITHMEIVSIFEEDFDISLDVEEITDMETIGIMKKILAKHGLKL